MNLKVGDIIKISDGKNYIISSQTIYKENEYYFLIEQDNFANMKICNKIAYTNRLVLVTDDETLKDLLPLFLENTKEQMDEIQSEETE